MGWLKKIILGMQEQLSILHHVGAIANGASVNDFAAVEGYAHLVGFIYSDRQVTVDIDTGVADQGGVLSYRHNQTFVVAAGTAIKNSFPIYAEKFVRVTVTNNSGAPANVETSWLVRGVF